MDAAAELGRNPVSKHKIQPEYGDEQADVGRPNADREIFICRTGNLTRLIHTLAKCVTIHGTDHTDPGDLQELLVAKAEVFVTLVTLDIGCWQVRIRV